MALTLGTGPLSRHPAGHFDVPPHRPIAFWEPFARRLRVSVDGEMVVDSRRATALHITGSPMQIAVPADETQLARLTRSAVRDDPRLGRLSGFSGSGSLRSDEEAADKPVLTEVTAPPAALSDLAGHFLVDFAVADSWWVEDDPGYAHPRDPYHRVDVHRTSRRVVVRLGDAIVAETDQPAILFETSIKPRFYLPPSAVRPGVLHKSETVSQCPYKGDGQHWHVEVGGHRVANAAWSLTTPMGDALVIPRWLSFYPDKVDVTVDGERLTGA